MARKQTKSGAESAASSEDKLLRIRSGKERETPQQSPLREEHLRILDQIIKECTITRQMCQDCMDAGIDVEPELKVNQEQLDMATKLKAKFFRNSA